MATFTLGELFGGFAAIEGQVGTGTLTIYTEAFIFESSYMPTGLGLHPEAIISPSQVLYSLLLRLMAVQAPKINDDPEQRIYIANAGKSLAREGREGQIKQSFTVSFFVDRGYVGLPPVELVDFDY
jgi:hypothetical protein